MRCGKASQRKLEPPKANQETLSPPLLHPHLQNKGDLWVPTVKQPSEMFSLASMGLAILIQERESGEGRSMQIHYDKKENHQCHLGGGSLRVEQA